MIDRNILIIMSMLVMLISAGCSCEKKVRIALMTKIESGSLVGISEVDAAKMYIEKNNVKTIEIIPFDDGWDPDKTIRAYRLMREQGIDLLVTSHVSTCAVKIKDMINRDRVLTVVTGATTDELSDSDDYIFRNVQDVSSEQRSIAMYIKEKTPRRLLIVRDTDNSGYTVPAMKHFAEYYKPGTVELIDLSISDFNPDELLKKMNKLRFDYLYIMIGGYKTAAGTVAQLSRRVSKSVPVMYTPWMKTPDILQTAGVSIEGSVIPSHYPAKGINRGVDKYMNEFREKYGYSPTFISLNVYSALQILHAAVSAGNRTPDSIKKFLGSKGRIITDFGNVEFNRYGDVDSRLFFITDIRGEFR
ncbi:MAG TPA: ABC transporter substrate-binding protein [Spirochaetota bacterium]|nr:ABC transporter substrate-binding protein [Spirochaetota bacterium]HPJ34343.1 ABC transporter substrate-binding protein [Spirochaetota bacterium]